MAADTTCDRLAFRSRRLHVTALWSATRPLIQTLAGKWPLTSLPECTRNACVVMPMGSLQIRDMPEALYEALAQRARRERRSLAQQAVADLSRLEELEARTRRELAVEKLRQRPRRSRLSDPVRIVRKDRKR